MNDPYAPIGEYDPEIFAEDSAEQEDDIIPFNESVMDEIDLLHVEVKGIISSKCATKPTFKGFAIYPLLSQTGEIVTGEMRIDYEDGEKKKKYVRPIAFSKTRGLIIGGAKGTLPLFNANEVIANPRDTVVVTEGPKKTLALEALLGPSSGYVVCSIIGGASSAKRFDWGPLQGRKVVILPDNDPPGMRFSIDAQPRCGNARIVDYERVGWLEVMNPKDDIADIIQRGATRDQVIDLIRNPRYEMTHGISLNPEFDVTINGIAKEEDGKKTPICSSIIFLGQAKNENNVSWSKHVRVCDYDHKLHDVLISDADIHVDANAVISKLVDHGMQIFDPKQFIYILKTLKSKNRSQIVRRPGWINGDFIIPGHRFSVKNHLRCISQGENANIDQKGDLRGWQEHVANFAIGNSSLMLGLGIGFGAPLLRLLNHDSTLFHFRGPSSSGKTISLLYCTSITGMECQSWRTTVNALEGICESHNDVALCIDELKQSDPHQAGAAAYMIANGKGKGRMTEKASNKPITNWRTIGFSTGEISLSEHVQGQTHAGQDVRFIDLQVSGMHGAFDNLHGYADGKAFAAAVKHAALSYRGTAIRPYLSYLLSSDRHDEMCAIRDTFILKVNGNSQAMRVAGHFAILAIGIEMAIKAKVLPWKSGIGIDAMLQVFNGWKDNHSQTGEYRRALLSLRDMISTQVSSFVDVNNVTGYVPATLLGFRTRNEDGCIVYGISASAWNGKLGSEVKNQTIRKQMAKDKILESEKAIQQRCPVTKANGRYCLVNADALDFVLQN
jgi:putative DNA primase/helicase